MPRIEDYRFVLQECSVCRARFPVIYQYKEQCIAPFGYSCDHIPGATFCPADNQPTFKEWYQEQVRIRGIMQNN